MADDRNDSNPEDMVHLAQEPVRPCRHPPDRDALVALMPFGVTHRFTFVHTQRPKTAKISAFATCNVVGMDAGACCSAQWKPRLNFHRIHVHLDSNRRSSIANASSLFLREFLLCRLCCFFDLSIPMRL
uniref:Uncharacterized protein n=1 Tax=Bionectria ochroleuca TaxID=29856 RepID=A0A8H7NAT9_BIOOC